MTNEAKKVVDELNEIVFDNSEYKEYALWFDYVSLPIGEYIKYAGECIWDSENDYRPWIDDDNKQDLKEYLLEQVQNIHSSMNIFF